MKTADVLFQNKDLLVLNKPPQIHMHPLKEGEQPTLFDQAIELVPSIQNAGPHPREGGLLHRLDFETSGAAAFACHPESYQFYRGLWKSNQIRKVYRAICQTPQTPLELPYEIAFPIGHSAKSSKKMICIRNDLNARQIKGKPQKAQSIIHRSTRTSSPNETDLEVEIITGVRHQIRVHLASTGCPIKGDSRYSGPPGSRLYLHAWKLSLPHREQPDTHFTIEAPIPWSLAEVS